MAKKNKGRVLLSHELILQLLNMPPETVITGAKHTPVGVELSLEHPDLPEIVEGGEGPYVKPKWTSQFVWGIE